MKLHLPAAFGHGVPMAVLKHAQNQIAVLGHLELHVIAFDGPDGYDGVGQRAPEIVRGVLGPVVFHGTVQRVICAVQAIDQPDRGFGGQRKTAFGDTVKNRVKLFHLCLLFQ